MTVQGPGAGLLERWVVGDVGIQVGRGVVGWPLGAMRRAPAVRPALGAALRGAGVELGVARWRVMLAAGGVQQGGLVAHRLGVAAVSGELGLSPARRLPGDAGKVLEPADSGRVRWAVWTACAGRGDSRDPHRAAGASLALVTSGHELRADLARTATILTFDLSARGVSVLGESRIRIALHEEGTRPASIAEPSSPTDGSELPSDAAPVVSRRLELTQRSGWRQFGVELVAAVRQRSAPGSAIAATLKRPIGADVSRFELRIRMDDEAWALATLVVADWARLGWARARDDGAAWVGRLGWRPVSSLWAELEARGWRGGGGRRASALLGISSVGAGRSLSASGFAGAIGTLRLSWQLRAVRVRLAVAKRQVREPLSRSLTSAEIQWSID